MILQSYLIPYLLMQLMESEKNEALDTYLFAQTNEEFRTVYY